MKQIKLIGSAAMLLACSVVSSQASLEIDFNAYGSAAVSFDGANHFSFAAGSGAPGLPLAQFQVGFSTTGDETGDFGYIGNPGGGYTIGSISVSGSTQSALVTGTGSFTIYGPGLATPLVATVNWESISTTGTGSTLNLNGVLNLTGISYSGSQADLLALAGLGGASDSVTFTFNPGVDLTTLATTTGHTTHNFSGVISATPVPEPTTLIAGAMLLLPFGASTLRMMRKNRVA